MSTAGIHGREQVQRMTVAAGRGARWLAIVLSGTSVLGGAALARAHHSFAMFDNSKKLTVTGTVRALEWSNPHIWLWVDVPDDKGNVVAYGFEGAAPGELSRMSNWTKRAVAPGEKVTVQFSPLKDGRPGGTLGAVTKADGTVLGNNARGGGPGGPPGAGGPPPAGAPPAR